MLDIILNAGPWAWLVLGLILIGFEIVAPGLFLIWLGLAACTIGIIAFLVAMSWQIELVLFVIAAIGFVWLGRKIHRSRIPEDAPFLNATARAMIGREFILEKPIINGVGSVRVNDSVWRVTGQDREAGLKVRVAAIDGSTLQVE
jgi:inner membrane protein